MRVGYVVLNNTAPIESLLLLLLLLLLLIARNSSGDEIANVNFLYDDIVHALKIQ